MTIYRFLPNIAVILHCCLIINVELIACLHFCNDSIFLLSISPAKVEGAGTSQFGFDNSWKPNRNRPTTFKNADQAKKALNFHPGNLNDVIMKNELESNGPLTEGEEFASSRGLTHSQNPNMISMS